MAMHYHRHGNALPSRWSCITITMVMHYHRDGEAPPPLASVETLAPAIMSQTEQTARSNAMAEPLATNGVRTCCWKSAASNHSKTLTMFWMRAGAHETVLSGQRGLALCCLGASPPLHRDPHHDVGRRSTVFQACLVHGAVSSSAKRSWRPPFVWNCECLDGSTMARPQASKQWVGPTRGKHTTSEPSCI